MTKVGDSLQGVLRIGIDTAPIIYFIEANPQYEALVAEYFQRISNGVLEGYCSVITLTEVLVQPLRQGNQQLAQEYSDLLVQSQHFTIVSLDVAIARTAADLRARYNLRTPDALQLATALESDCHAFLTNDATLSRIAEIRVIILDDLEP